MIKRALAITALGLLTLATFTGCSAPSEVTSHPGFSAQYSKLGYYAFEEDGRLWVFAADSSGLDEYLKSGEPAKSVTLIKAGPDGKTIRSTSKATINAYMMRP